MNNKNLRIACYGFVKKGAGASRARRSSILEELLKRNDKNFRSITNNLQSRT